jgi:YaiO family outer membrane protein
MERIGIVLIAAMLSFSLVAQSQTGGPEELYRQARAEALAGQRREARALCEKILESNPGYLDARLLLGRLYAWDGVYDAARRELKSVLEAKPDYAEAREALIDVEFWTGNLDEAMRLAEEGTVIDPGNQTFRYKKARALRALGDLKGASSTVDESLKLDPRSSNTRSLSQQLKDEQKVYRARIEYTSDLFDNTFDPWHLVSISLSRQMSWGTALGRLNYASRFGRQATQFEIDAYPQIRKGTYAYLNGGYSSSSIFPRVRVGAEIYQSLPRSFETSFGVRYLRFSGDRVTIYTGSLGIYHGNYWLSFRPFITPGTLGTSFSGNLTVRRYFKDGENYISFVAGAGSAPDERYTSLELIRLKSQKFSIDVRKQLNHDWGGLASFGFSNEELSSGGVRKRYTFGFGIEKKF